MHKGGDEFEKDTVGGWSGAEGNSLGLTREEAMKRLSFVRHEVNNVLAILKSNFDFVKSEIKERGLDLGEEGKGAFSDMGDAIGRLEKTAQMTPSELDERISQFNKGPSENKNPLKEGAVEIAGQKILFLIDDETGITSALRRIVLGAFGHGKKPEIMVFSSALEAKKAIESGKRPDYTICDFMMPEMTGMEYYEWLKVAYPELANKIMFLSGGTFDSSSGNPIINEIIEKKMLITKPYDTKAVLGRVQSALGNR